MLRLKSIPFLVMITTCLATNAFAVAPGFYMGLMAGPAKPTGSTEQAQIQLSNLTTPVKPSSSVAGGRLFMGDDITDYFGIEGGFTYFSRVDYDTVDENVTTYGNADADVGSFDLVGKVILPLDAFSLYAKAGADVAFTQTSGALNPPSPPVINPDGTFAEGKSHSDTHAGPTFGVGASYDLTQNWVADVSYNRMMTGDPVDAFNFIALGISYHFVDKYCGQFLCDE